MSISRARKGFRVFLAVALVLSLTFFAGTSYIYIGVKNKTISLAQITPTLFAIDIAQYQLQAALSSSDKKLSIAKRLYQQGVFSIDYAHAGEQMILDMAEKGNPEAQTAYGDIIYAKVRATGRDENRLPLAQDYYRKAAEQGHKPAQERLANLTYNATIAFADALRP